MKKMQERKEISEEELRNRQQYLILSTLHQFSPAHPNTLKCQYQQQLQQL